jgi:hypothetical protein
MLKLDIKKLEHGDLDQDSVQLQVVVSMVANVWV